MTKSAVKRGFISKAARQGDRITSLRTTSWKAWGSGCLWIKNKGPGLGSGGGGPGERWLEKRCGRCSATGVPKLQASARPEMEALPTAWGWSFLPSDIKVTKQNLGKPCWRAGGPIQSEPVLFPLDTVDSPKYWKITQTTILLFRLYADASRKVTLTSEGRWSRFD